MSEFNMTLVALVLAGGFVALPLALALSPVAG